jgi:hypothetical protein
MRRNFWMMASVLAAVGFGWTPFGTASVLAGAQAQTQTKEPIPVTTGKFHKVNHQTTGTATVYEFEGGARELRIKDLDTGNGPALHVYLVADGDAKSSGDVKKAGYIDLGKLATRKGDSVYVVPKDIDLWKYRAVTVWCKKFGVNFGTAPLAAAGK